jgi:hypothetical protein
MSDVCDLYSVHCDKVSIILSFITMVAAFFVGWKANQISHYQSQQADREIIQEIYKLYSLVVIEFAQERIFPKQAYATIRNAYDLSVLYKFKEIENYIKTQINYLNEYEALRSGQHSFFSHDPQKKPKLDSLGDMIVENYFSHKNIDIFRKYAHIRHA